MWCSMQVRTCRSMPSLATELTISTSYSGGTLASPGRAQVPGSGGSLARPLNSRAMRTRSAGAAVSALRMAMRSRGMPCSTRVSRIHWWVAVGSQKITWPQCALAAMRRAHSMNFGLA
jgi:hypothetical protein